MQATLPVRRFSTVRLQAVLAITAALILALAVGFWLRVMAPQTMSVSASQAAYPASGALVQRQAPIADQSQRSSGTQY